MTELKPINFGMNKFCVPSVMSSLTGMSTDECAAAISAVNGRKEIKAVNIPDIIAVFKRLRFEIEEITSQARTLYGSLNRLSSSDGLYLILVPHHIVAIRIHEGQIQICDNASREPLDARSSARLTQSVDKIFKVSPRQPPVFVFSEILVEKSKYYNKLDIKRINHYRNHEDNTENSLGYVSFKDGAELTGIVSALNDYVLLGIVASVEDE